MPLLLLHLLIFLQLGSSIGWLAPPYLFPPLLPFPQLSCNSVSLFLRSMCFFFFFCVFMFSRVWFGFWFWFWRFKMEPMDIVGKSKEDASLPKGNNFTFLLSIFWTIIRVLHEIYEILTLLLSAVIKFFYYWIVYSKPLELLNVRSSRAFNFSSIVHKT